MFRKALLTAATLAVTATSIAATTGSASAGGHRWNNHDNYQRVVCQPVFEWKRVWSDRLYRYVTIRVKVDETCFYVPAPRYNRWY